MASAVIALSAVTVTDRAAWFVATVPSVEVPDEIVELAPWSSTGLIQSGDSHVLDGMHTDTCTPANGGGSYNQGMMIDGLVEYWQATGTAAALTKATGIGDMLLNTSYYKASGIMRDGCEAGSGVCAGGENFKATAIRGLAALNRVLSSHPYSSYISTNATTMFANDKTPLSQYGLKWNGPVSVTGVGSQSAAVELFNATHLNP